MGEIVGSMLTEMGTQMAQAFVYAILGLTLMAVVFIAATAGTFKK